MTRMDIKPVVYTIVSTIFFIKHGLSFYPEEKMQSVFNRPDLRCPYNCSYDPPIHQMHCCICNSYQQLDDIGTLTIVFSKGTARVVNTGNTHVYFSLTYNPGNLSKIPENICQFTEIVKIDFSFNMIKDIGNISCLENLDTLLLQGNAIEHLSNKTFRSMKNLRLVDLSYNKLSYIEPGIFINMDGSLFLFNVSHNYLSNLDITNALWTKQKYFCASDFSYNQIKTVSNELGWKAEARTTFWFGGMVIASNNNISTFFDVKHIGFENTGLLGKLMFYGFDVRNNPWNCDCKLYPFAKKARDFAKRMYRDYFEIYCQEPSKFKNKSILDIVINEDFKHLTCEISLAQKCPPRCHCLYQPAVRNRTIVNCSNAGLKKIPSKLPENINLEVDFSRNRITAIEHTSKFVHNTFGTLQNQFFFKNIRALNLSDNKIRHIRENVLHDLKNVSSLDLRGNMIDSIQRTFQNLNPCHLILGNLEMKCSCHDIWLQQWLPSTNEKCHNNTQIMCKTENGLVSISQMTRKDLGCNIQNASVFYVIGLLVSVTVVILISTGIAYSFRFEIFILTKIVVKSYIKEVESEYYMYDVYLSCNDDIKDIRLWLMESLIPYLEIKGLCVYFPCRDDDIGKPREAEMIRVMSKCRNFLIILSEGESEGIGWHHKEWKYAWMNYRSNFNRDIIIVNYDMLRKNEITNKYLRAFLRLGRFIDFANRQNSIAANIAQKVMPKYKEIQKGSRKSFHTLNISECETSPLMKKYPLYSQKKNIYELVSDV